MTPHTSVALWKRLDGKAHLRLGRGSDRVARIPRITDDILCLFLADTGVEVDLQITENVWLETGRRFLLYADRRRAAINEGPRRLLADFIIGTHAMLHADRLMTFDAALYKRNFPELPLLTPATE